MWCSGRTAPWLVDGSVIIHRVNEVLDLAGASPVEEHDAYHTLAGMVISKLGRIPAAGVSFESAVYRFEVMDMDHNRVDKVLISRAVTQRESRDEQA